MTRETLKERARALVDSRSFERAIATVIVINAISLGLETWPKAVEAGGEVLHAIDRTALWIFTAEIALKLWAHGRTFFRRGWNLFDLTIVAIAWVPTGGAFSVMRALRMLRVLRLISVVPQMRTVVGALIHALPGMGSIVAVLLLVFYVAAVMATMLFGADYPEWFGSIGESMYSLFQIMTLESWSMGLVRPVMETHPFAWAFFVPFVIITSFAVLNLFIALIVNAMQAVHEEDRVQAEATASLAHDERQVLLEEIAAMRETVERLARRLQGPSG